MSHKPKEKLPAGRSHTPEASPCVHEGIRRKIAARLAIAAGEADGSLDKYSAARARITEGLKRVFVDGEPPQDSQEDEE